MSDLRRRDAERAASHRSELSSEEMEERIQEFQQQMPLVESLQKELASTQVGSYHCYGLINYELINGISDGKSGHGSPIQFGYRLWSPPTKK